MPQDPYCPVTPSIVAELRAITGAPNVICDEPDRMLDYAHDETQAWSTATHRRLW
jgi:hypothetical protein